MFPKDTRSIGTGYTVGCNGLFNIAVNFLYPVGLSLLSPPGGSNQRGMSLCLLIFGAMGVVTATILLKYLGLTQYIASTM
jgi:hypothetical protein